MARYIFKRKLFGMFGNFFGRNIRSTLSGVSEANRGLMNEAIAKRGEAAWAKNVADRANAYYDTEEGLTKMTGLMGATRKNVMGTNEFKALENQHSGDALKQAQDKMIQDAQIKAREAEIKNWGQNNTTDVEKANFMRDEAHRFRNSEDYKDFHKQYEDLSNGQRAWELTKGLTKIGVVAPIGLGAAAAGTAQLVGGVPVTGAISDMRNATKEDF